MNQGTVQQSPLITAALERCATEVIHLPGTIQSHGMMVVADAGLTIRHVSDNVRSLLGQEPGLLLGSPLKNVFGAELVAQMQPVIETQESGLIVPVRCAVNDARDGSALLFAGQVHFNDNLYLIELEQSEEVSSQEVFENQFLPLRDALWALEREADIGRYMSAIAAQVAKLTQIDRVMVYRFDSQWDGEVIAEVLNADVEAFLGHHFPAADIPPQARDLYVKNRLRIIADVKATPVPIYPPLNQRTSLPLDLSYAALRSFSPVHLEYLSNMGVSATLTMSLVANGRLWGLIACHHHQPLRLPVHVRELADFISRTASLRIGDIEQASISALHERGERALDALAEAIVDGAECETSGSELMALIGASGMVVCVNRRKHQIGQVPDVAVIMQLAEWLRSEPASSCFHTDGLPDLFPPAGDCGGSANGLMVVPLDHEMKDFVMWFRPEILRSVKWAGNPEKNFEHTDDGVRISPRKSFSAWVQSYAGHSAKWSFPDIDVGHALSLSLLARISDRQSGKSGKRSVIEPLASSDQLAGSLDRDFRYIQVAGQTVAMLGFHSKELYGHPLIDFVFEEDVRQVSQYLIRILAGEIAEIPLVFRHSLKDGRYAWLELSAELIQDGPRSEIRFSARNVTERQHYNERLESMQSRHRHMVDARRDGIISLDTKRTILYANEAAYALLGWPVGELVGKHYCDNLCFASNCPESGRLYRNQSDEIVDPSGQSIHCEVVALRHFDGHKVPVRLWSIELSVSAGAGPAEILLLHPSGVDEVGQQRDLLPEQVGIFVTDRHGTIKAVNDGFSRITGYGAHEVVGRTPSMLRSNIHSNHFYKQFWSALLHERAWCGEIWNRRKSGELYPQFSTVLAIQGLNDQIQYYVAIFQDVSNTTAVGEKNHFLPDFDSLTGLPSRMLFERQLNEIIASANEQGSFGVAFIDIDNYKAINDALGHITGDRLLYLIASRLNNKVRDGDLFARWGGDKFILLMREVDSEDEATTRVDRFLFCLNDPFQIAGKTVGVVARVGICLYPRDGANADQLMHAGDAAQSRAKATGLGAVCFFDAAAAQASADRFQTANDLRTAIKEHQFFMAYQPQVNAATGAVVGLEALVRWRHPVRGLVPPVDFIAVAEDQNLMEDLGIEILQMCFSQIRDWRQAGDFSIPVGINVAPVQLKPSFIGILQSLLESYQVPPALIEIEITESALQPTPEIREVVRGIKGLGVSLAIDDFGTGYSSLSHLKLFPFDRLKIDKSFVDGLPSDGDDGAIAQAIVALGRALKVDVLAEGVESGEQAAYLKQEGVNAIQGYLYSKPLMASDVQKYIESTLSNDDVQLEVCDKC